MTNRSRSVVPIAAAVLLLASSVTYGTLIKDVLYGLGIAGLNPRVQRDVFQDGWTVDFGSAFNDTKYDFGNVELTLNGALQGSFGFGRRGIDEVAFSLETPGGLTFDLVEFDGINKISIDNGLLNINQNMKINRFGFYDIRMFVTGRGEVVAEGPLAGTQNIDFDIGPIDIHGHWLVDVVNLTLGRAFGFVLPGGAADTIVMGFIEQADVAGQFVEKANKSPAGIVLVPEPATLLILMLGVPLLWWKRLR